MRQGSLRPLGNPSGTPGRVFENLFITGSNTGEMYQALPGDIRAYDIVTGKLVWTFHTIPHPGEFGYDTWPEGAYKWAGGVNVWGEISIDSIRGIGYFPLGSPTHDSYGGDRKGANLFGNSLVALDLRTGKRLWHFQTVHHDHLGLRPHDRAEVVDGAPQRPHGGRRRASDEVRIALRLRSRDRPAALADRGAAGAKERCARRGELADAAVSRRSPNRSRG